jgi:putative membrane protein
MLGRDVPVKSFVSERNGEILSVQFVMQTEGISIPDEVEEIKPEPKLTFWQRLIRLFGFRP